MKLVCPGAWRALLLLLSLKVCRPAAAAAGAGLAEPQALKLLCPVRLLRRCVLLLLLLLRRSRHGRRRRVLAHSRGLGQAGCACCKDLLKVGCLRQLICRQFQWVDVERGQEPVHLLVCRPGRPAQQRW